MSRSERRARAGAKGTQAGDRHAAGPGTEASAGERARERDRAPLRTTRAVTVAQRRSFLDALALSCNVRLSADHVGVCPTMLYQARQCDEAFAEAWRRALATGYDRLEAMVLEHVGAALPLTGDPDRAIADGAPVSAFDFDKAMRTLAAYRAVRDGRPSSQPGRKQAANATREETNKVLLRALAAAARRVTAREAAAAQAAAGPLLMAPSAEAERDAPERTR